MTTPLRREGLAQPFSGERTGAGAANQAGLVLIVDDEPLIADLVQHALQDAGFASVQGCNADEAFALLDTEGAGYIAVVTDINLGPGPDGWAVARHARKQHAGVAIVYCSGASAHEWPLKGVRDSVLLTKPFAPAQIVRAVTGQLAAQ